MYFTQEAQEVKVDRDRAVDMVVMEVLGRVPL
jgi:hypothetical protein